VKELHILADRERGGGHALQRWPLQREDDLWFEDGVAGE
jgi:hypothetical protein